MFDLEAFIDSLPSDHFPARVPPSEYANRVARVQAMLRERGLGAGLAYGTEGMPGDTGWLTGYDPQIESTAVVVGPAGAFILGGPWFARYAGEMAPAAQYRLYGRGRGQAANQPGSAHRPHGARLRDGQGEAAVRGAIDRP